MACASRRSSEPPLTNRRATSDTACTPQFGASTIGASAISTPRGAVAAQNLLDTTTSIGKLRGKIHQYRSIKVVCTYHPAFLLRSPAFKKETWEDMKFLMREMGVELG